MKRDLERCRERLQATHHFTPSLDGHISTSTLHFEANPWDRLFFCPLHSQAQSKAAPALPQCLLLAGLCKAGFALRQGKFPNFLLNALPMYQSKSGHCSRPHSCTWCHHKESLGHPGQCRRVGDFSKTAPACPVQQHQQQHHCVKVCGFFWAGWVQCGGLSLSVNSPAKSLQRGGTGAGPTSTKPAAKKSPAAAVRD